MNIEEFIGDLKRDKARGELAPHQIILMLSLYRLNVEQSSTTINILDLINSFELVWKENQNKFKTKNCNLGMPLKVFVNRGYIEIDIYEEINDFRSKTELKTKVKHLKISPLLKIFLKGDKVETYLKSRIKI